MAKETVTKFDFEAAFKALNEIEAPAAPKGRFKANRVNLHERLQAKDAYTVLVEDYYDVNDTNELASAKEEREAEVAKAKLARIEKIVDLDAETEEDILPSYVGKFIIQCPQCMTLFYKNEEDIEKSEETPDVVNINEVCQHCGNDSGYTLVGKVGGINEDEAENFEVEDVEDDELNLDFPAVEDEDEAETVETPEDEETTAEEEEFNLDDLDLDLEDEEETNESVHRSKLLKAAQKKTGLKSDIESDHLTLNEKLEDTEEPIEEDIADWYRKKFDRPASTETQQAWEDELNGEFGEISDKRRKHLERKFAQQRDWEARHEVEAEAEATPAEEPAMVESMHNSELLDKIEDKNELKTDIESEHLTLNEAISPEVEAEIKKHLGLYTEKIDVSNDGNDIQINSELVDTLPNKENGHKEMLDALKKNGYTVVDDQYMYNSLVKKHLSFITVKAKAGADAKEGLIGDTLRGAVKGFLGASDQAEKQSIEAEEGLIGDTIRGAARGFLGASDSAEKQSIEAEEGLIGDTIRGAARGFLGASDQAEKQSIEAEAVKYKQADSLCAVMNGDKQVFAGTKEECENWLKDKTGPLASRFKIVQGAEVPVAEEGLIGDTLRGAVKGFLGEEKAEEGLIGDTLRGAVKGFLGASDQAEKQSIEAEEGHIEEEHEQCDEGIGGSIAGGAIGGLVGRGAGKNVGKAVGGAAGTAIGASIGGKVGGPVGAVVGGIAGNMIGKSAGKTIGKNIGGAAGAAGGAAIGNKLQDKISNKNEGLDGASDQDEKQNIEAEEGLIGDTLRGAVKGFLGEEVEEKQEGLIGDTLRGAVKGFLGEETDENKWQDAEDFDECFDKSVTEYLHETYSNVKSYTSTNCALLGKSLIIEGTIHFKSGKSTATKFVFEAVRVNNGRVSFVGLNESFSNKQNAFKLVCSTANNKLITERFGYRYQINESLVEGLK